MDLLGFTDLTASLPELVGWILTTLGLLILLVGLIWLIFYSALKFHMWRERERRAMIFITLLVAVPRENEIKIDAMEQFFASLSSMSKSKKFFFDLIDLSFLVLQEQVAFEIVGLPGDIRFYVSVSQKFREQVEKQIHAIYPGALVTEAEDYNIYKEEGEVAHASFKLKSHNFYPIKIFRDLAVDPLSSLTSALAKLVEGEAAAIQFIVSPADGKWQSYGHKYVAKTKKSEADPEKAKFNVDAKSLEAIENKVSKPGFSTSIRIVCSAKSSGAVKQILDNIKASFAQFNSNQNRLVGVKWMLPANFMMDFIYKYQPLFTKPSILNSEELATLFHFPNKSIETPNIFWLNAKRAPAPQEVPESGGILLGKSIFRGQKKDVCILKPDRRRHVYIIGATGTGKSVLLSQMILQDIRNGEGVCFIDPHDTYEDILQLMPPERVEDVIYFDPSNMALRDPEAPA